MPTRYSAELMANEWVVVKTITSEEDDAESGSSIVEYCRSKEHADLVAERLTTAETA